MPFSSPAMCTSVCGVRERAIGIVVESLLAVGGRLWVGVFCAVLHTATLRVCAIGFWAKGIWSGHRKKKMYMFGRRIYGNRCHSDWCYGRHMCVPCCNVRVDTGPDNAKRISITYLWCEGKGAFFRDEIIRMFRNWTLPFQFVWCILFNMFYSPYFVIKPLWISHQTSVRITFFYDIDVRSPHLHTFM